MSKNESVLDLNSLQTRFCWWELKAELAYQFEFKYFNIL